MGIAWRDSMKLGQKLYLFTIILFIATVSFSGIIFIQKNFDLSLKSEIERFYSVHSSIRSSLETSLPVLRSLSDFEMDDHKLNDKIIYRFALDYTSKVDGTYIEILDMSNNSIYSNIDFRVNSDRPELDVMVFGERRAIIRDIDDKTLLFVTSLTEINEIYYKLTYVGDISSVYILKHDAYSVFFKLGVAIVILFAIFMLLITRVYTKPINYLIQITKEISLGAYDARIDYTTNDELGVLAKNFNFMADSVEQNIEELKRVNLQKEEFIDSFTHEIKTPLTSIIGFANLLRTTKYDEDTYLQAVDFIYSEGKRLEALSVNLMDLMVLKKHEFNMQIHDLGQLLDAVSQSMDIKLRSKDINITIECLNIDIRTEESLFKLLLTNLIDNAIKASNNDSEIIVAAIENQYEIELCVQDFGIGIPIEKIKDICEPFYVVDSSRTLGSNGAGLGLAICDKIVKVHGGTMTFVNGEERGTIVKIVFPKGVIHGDT